MYFASRFPPWERKARSGPLVEDQLLWGPLSWTSSVEQTASTLQCPVHPSRAIRANHYYNGDTLKPKEGNVRQHMPLAWSKLMRPIETGS